MAITRWTIKQWEPGPCPKDAFEQDHDLILKEGADSYAVVWMDKGHRLCWIDDLPKPMGTSYRVPVQFGTETVDCEVTLNLAERWLTGTLKPGNDGSAGTFGAEANGPLPE